MKFMMALIYALAAALLMGLLGVYFYFSVVQRQSSSPNDETIANIALLLFVGIPLPGTGAWTGTLAASILDMDFKSSIIAVMLGVILAGIIMGLASAGVFGAVGAIFAIK